MKFQTENIFQVIELNISASELYNIFMNEQKHTAFTGKKACIEAEPGGSFSFCNGNHTGHFLKLVENKLIVLAWTHKKFPRNRYSIVHLQFEKTENGCRLSMNHTGVPESCDGWLTEAWNKTYWEPLSKYIVEEELEFS
ncbi:MAG: SRPBCC domain-containing protein [Flavobacteriales bacterium]|nr:SRPBCC domain-containing protein [Flavobacteriales bacterium]